MSGLFFDEGEDIRVLDVDSALLAIRTIVEQGEGTPKSPLDLQKDIAHYYAFEQFSKGMRIVRDPAEPLKVHFDATQPLSIDDSADVIPMIDDPPLVTYAAADWRAEQLSAEADASYSKILRGLHRGFNGEPGMIENPVGAMFEFKTIVGELLQQQLTAGPLGGSRRPPVPLRGVTVPSSDCAHGSPFAEPLMDRSTSTRSTNLAAGNRARPAPIPAQLGLPQVARYVAHRQAK